MEWNKKYLEKMKLVDSWSEYWSKINLRMQRILFLKKSHLQDGVM